MNVTVFHHNSKEWGKLYHGWQVRAIDFLSSMNGRILISEEYPSLVVVCADDSVDDGTIRNWFALQPEEIGEFSVHHFPNAPTGISDEQIIKKVASEILHQN